jgi:hypothetical protein
MSNKEKLSYPDVKTFYICFNNERSEIKSYGSISPQQCFATNWIEIDYYTNKTEWTKILLQNGIEREVEE